MRFNTSIFGTKLPAELRSSLERDPRNRFYSPAESRAAKARAAEKAKKNAEWRAAVGKLLNDPDVKAARRKHAAAKANKSQDDMAGPVVPNYTSKRLAKEAAERKAGRRPTISIQGRVLGYTERRKIMQEAAK